MKKPQKELQELKDQKEKWIELSNVIKFLESKGLEIKECVYNKSRSEFVKGKLFEEKIKENLEEVCKRINKIMKTDISPTKPDKAIQEIYKQFKSVNLISKACREDGDKKKNVKRLLPYEQLALLFKCNCGKNHEELENPDHQKKLDVDKILSFEPSFFYVLNVNRGKSKIYFYLILIVIAILMYALMPVWPYQLRVALYWISYVLLCIMIGIYVVKLIVYVFFYTFGYDVLIFPDMDDPKLGVIDSFKRVISVEKRKDKWYFLILRVILAIITGYIAFCVYKNPKLIDQTQKLIVDAIRDIYHYGEDRFVNNNSTAISLKNKKKYISLEDLDNF